jgi:hypothetical protein
MPFREAPRLFDVVLSEDFSCKVRFCDVLQAGDLGVIEKTAARANVGIDEARIGRVLPPVRELVAVGVEDRVEAKGLNRASLKCCCYVGAGNLKPQLIAFTLPKRGAARCAPTVVIAGQA